MKSNKLKVGNYVRGIFSPFVHGKIEKIEGAFARLEDDSVYPLVSLKKSTKKEMTSLPNFIQWTKSSKPGLGIFK